MKRHFSRFFAVEAAVAWAVCVCAAQAAGIPVFDAGNILESARQTAEQIKQYEIQVKQLKNMVRNTDLPTEEVWNRAQVTIDQLQAAMQTLNQYRQQAGSLQATLEKFKDVEGYLLSRCAGNECSEAQRAQMTQEHGRIGARLQKSANDALLRSLDQQHRAMATDASRLQHLQNGAKSAAGQMQALGAANQLAVQQAHQLQQIRVLLMAQNTALGARLQAMADRDARARAAQETALAPRLGDTRNPLNWLSIKH